MFCATNCLTAFAMLRLPLKQKQCANDLGAEKAARYLAAHENLDPSSRIDARGGVQILVITCGKNGMALTFHLFAMLF